MPKKKIQTEEISPKSLENLISSLKNYLQSNDETGTPKWFLNTGNLAFNYIISGNLNNGYPGGKTIELFGEPSTGKTLLIAKAGAEIQRIGGIFVIMDAECRWDDDFATVHGVDVEKRILFNPESVEEFTVKTADILEKCAESNTKALISLDSIAQLTHEKELRDFEDDGEIKSDQGQKAKKMHAMTRLLKKKVYDTGSILLASNHVISNPNSPNPHARLTPAGRAFPFQATVRIEFGTPYPIAVEGKDRPIGVTLQATCTKNSIAPPWGKCVMDVFWKRGLNKYSGLLALMKDIGIVQSSNAGWYSYNNKSFRERELPEIIEKFPEILDEEIWKKPYWMED